MKYLKYFFFIPASVALLVASCSKSTTNAALTSGNWLKRSDAAFSGRSEAISFTIDSTVYVGTGFDNYASNFPGQNTSWYNYGRTNDLWAFNQSANSGWGSWSQLSNMVNGTDTAQVRSSAIAFATSGSTGTTGKFGYVATGYDGQYRLQDNWQYNPQTNTWMQKASLPDNNTYIVGSGARYDAVAFCIRDTGYIAGGTSNRDLNDLWQYIPSSDSWIQQTSIGGSGRSAAVCFVYHDSIAYVVTGTNNGATLNDFWSYNPSTRNWSPLRNITNTSTDTYDDDYTDIVRSNAVIMLQGDYAYLATGQNGGYTNQTWMYDIKQDLWGRKTPFERSARGGAVGFTVAGRVFVATGAASGTYFNGVEEFRQDEEYNAND